MEALKIKASKDTPGIIFDLENNLFTIEGNSLPENAATFYKPVYENFLQCLEQRQQGLNLTLDLNYLNSSSVKFIFALLMKMEEAFKQSNQSSHKVIWRYKKEDELMKQKGEEFSSFLSIPFETIDY